MRYTFELYEDFSTGKLRRSNSNALSSSLSFWIGNEKSSLLLLLTFYVYFSLKNVTLTMIGRTVLARTATRAVARREMSTAPKMHRAKEMWPELEKTRAPKDHDDLHLVFHPPFNFAVTTALVVGIAVAGWGVIYAGFRHQQYKQGFWK